MSKTTHDLLAILVIAVVTFLLRALPFMLFSEKHPVPHAVSVLSNVLPSAVIGMLVVYCLKSISFASSPFGLPEIIAGSLVAATYIWKRNTLISVLSGTVVYMLLIQFVF